MYGKGDLISYRDFLEDVKYSISEKVTTLIAQAFDNLDPNNTNKVSLETINKRFIGEKHPHVLTRRKKIEDVIAELNNGLTRKAVNGNITRQDFIDYYA